MKLPFKAYEEIPELIIEYMLTVAEKKSIMEIPLEEINSFLVGLHQYYKTKPELEEDGWIL